MACASPPPPSPAPAAAESAASLLRRAADTTDDAAAVELLHRALKLAPRDAEVHERLLERTGMAPRDPPPRGRAEAKALVRAHPYDPWACLMAARTAQTPAAAAQYLRWALMLGDVDPAVTVAAARELRRVDPTMAERRIVGVHFVADETVRAEPGWRFQLRLELQALSETLDPVTKTLFVPVSMDAFDGSQVSAYLSDITAAGMAALGRMPRHGIVAIVTERRPPPGRAAARLGEAEFLGRRLTARLTPGEVRSRVLAHEVLHLYGAAHLSDRVDSLMNPDGGAWILRKPNVDIVKQTRTRRFGPGGLEANVLPYVDVDATAEAYLSLIDVNLALRRAGVREILRDTWGPRARAQRLRKLVKIDPNTADVCDFTARLLVVAKRPRQAVKLFELAARLYGLETPKGKDSLRRMVAVKETLPPEPDSQEGAAP